MVSATPTSCPICGADAEVVRANHPGYAAPTRFAIAECCYCDAQFASPCVGDDRLYERIYEHARTLPGYSRYVWYADRIARQAEPLRWLASRQEMYGFIAREVARLDPRRQREIVEVGSGLGYLTFALLRAGHRARGFDLSATAVAGARARFGDHYIVADATAAEHAASADLVVMTEVLEHVADPARVVAGIARLLRPGGAALITTPSKSAHPSGAVWATDNPPVHLWWFSETTIRRLAERAGLHVSFPVSTGPSSRSEPALEPNFDQDRRQRAPSPLTRRAIELIPWAVFPVAAVLRNLRKRGALRAMASQRGPSIGAVLTKGTAHSPDSTSRQDPCP